jgi:outer membrane protein assembly factor BamD (BamD/ComL family)
VRARRAAALCAVACQAALLLGAGGCAWDNFTLVGPKPAPAPSGPEPDSLVLRAEGLVQDRGPVILADAKVKNGAWATLRKAHDAFRQEQYAKAESLFEDVADDSNSPPALVMEAMYYRGESLRLQGKYPKAADVYGGMLNKFPQNPYRDQALQRLYDIACYWLKDTEDEMKEAKEVREGKRWFVTPRFVSIDKTKPTIDREGRAIEVLENVRMYDVRGPLADSALYKCGAVKLFRENYREADYYFGQIVKHKDSPLRPKALKLSIFCKNMCTGGSDFDGRKVAEARELVQTAFTAYPDLASENRDFLVKQLKGITLQQAEQDYKKAEFYARTGHPGSAYWYFEVVRRRYPDTKFAAQAVKRMNELRSHVEREQGAQPPPSPSGAPAGAPAPSAGVPPAAALAPPTGSR